MGVLTGCASDNDAAGAPSTTAAVITVAETSTAVVPGSSVPGSSAPVATAAPVTAAANGKTTTIRAIDNNFVAQNVTVQAGTNVQWSNRGRNDHDVVPVDATGAAAWGVSLKDFQPGATYSHVFTTPGSYVYICTIHGSIVNGKGVGMVGLITVTT
ncbi:MAG: plastocyanin/azurin family copper-binding protein [Ilumatobacteraceae bacterium]